MKDNVVKSGKYNWPKAISFDTGPYIFISYSHRNSVLACHDFSLLSSYEIPFWYDDGMVPGQDWKEKARFAMYHPNCKGVIFYVSRSSVASPAIYEELKMASELMIIRDEFSVFSVNIGGKSINQMIKEDIVPPKYADLYQKIFPTDTIYIIRKNKVSSTDHICYLLDFLNEKKMLKKKYLSLVERNPFVLSPYKDAFVITHFRGDAEDVVIPESIGKKRIIAIGPNAFAFNTKLKKVYVRGDVREIFDSAFEGCKNLLSIVFNDTLLRIGNNSFKTCTKLKIIVFPSRLCSLGDYAFYQCKSLVSVNCNKASIEIGYACFSQCISLREIKSTENIVSIGGYAFGGCIFEDFMVFDKVGYMGTDCFVSNPKLKYIFFKSPYLPRNTAQSIVALCPKFKSLIIPVTTPDKEFERFKSRESTRKKLQSVSEFSNDCDGFIWEKIAGVDEYRLTIDEHTFVTQDSRLTFAFSKKTYRIQVISHNDDEEIEDANVSFNYTIKMPVVKNNVLVGGSFDKGAILLKDNIIKIGKRAFEGDLNIKELVFEGNEVGASAFESALNLITARFNRPLSLGNSAFRNCAKLVNVDFDKVREIGACCFENCGMLEKVIFREGICCIPQKAFRRCIRIKEFVFPMSLVEIGQEALRGCMGLTSLRLPESLTTIGDGALTYLTIKEIVLPHSLEKFGENNLQSCSYLEKISIEKNELFSIENGCLLHDKTTLLRFPPARKDLNVVIPDCVTVIAKDAFRDSSYVETIVAKNVRRIERGAFYGCSSLQLVVLRGNIERIEREAFIHCPNLSRVEIKSKKRVKIEQNAIDNVVELEITDKEENV